MERMKTAKPTDLLDNWSYIKGYDNKYTINIFGNVWSYTSTTNKKGKALTVSKHKNGLLYVTLHKDGKANRHYIHKLVAEHFKANPNGFKYIRHIDGNKANNNVCNLEWVNKSIADRKIDPKELPPTLCKSFVKVLKNEYGAEIRKLFGEGMTISELEKNYGATRYQIESCIYGTPAERKQLEYHRSKQEELGKDKHPDSLFEELLVFYPKTTREWNNRKDMELILKEWEENGYPQPDPVSTKKLWNKMWSSSIHVIKRRYEDYIEGSEHWTLKDWWSWWEAGREDRVKMRDNVLQHLEEN